MGADGEQRAAFLATLLTESGPGAAVKLVKNEFLLKIKICI